MVTTLDVDSSLIDCYLQGLSIPVNIRVTDANDNAPQFVNAPYVLNISEVSGAQMKTGACAAWRQAPQLTVNTPC